MLVLILLSLSVGARPAHRAANRKKHTRQGLQASGILTFHDGTFYSRGSKLFGAGSSAQPYRLVALGKYATLTTIDADLVPSTWTTDGRSVNEFHDMLPLAVQPPLAVLAGLAPDVSGLAGGVTLLGTNGSAAWHNDHADALLPAAGPVGSHALCIIPDADATPIAAYGSRPTLAWVNCPSGKEAWRVWLSPSAPVEDAQLYAVGKSAALLSLQYGYTDFEFFRLDLATGQTKTVRYLSGVPAMRTTYPGPQVTPTGVELHGNRISVVVSMQDKGWRKWTYDLSRGTLRDAGAQAPLTLTEENDSRQVSGPPAATLFPQHLLPTEDGPVWSIPALVNAQGQIFVVSAAGAGWFSLD